MSDPTDIVERLREALAAVQNFRGDLDSDDFNDACAGLRFQAAQAAPVLLAEIDRLRAALAQPAALIDADNRARVASLAPREREVLVLLSKGQTNPEISDALGLADATVAQYRKTLFKRLGVCTLAEAAVIAAKTGLV